MHLNQVFERLLAAGLHVKRKKCHFATNKCVYLGHVIGGGTISPMQCKVKAVQEFSQLKNKKQVRSYLGLCGYYQKFISNFSTAACPLSNLTKKDQPKQVKWTYTCETAFMELKETLSRDPILATPDWMTQFILQTDAFGMGLGFVFSQINSKGD